MRILRMADANTEVASSAIDDKHMEGVSSTSTTESKTGVKEQSPLAIAAQIATNSPGGEGEDTPDKTKEDDKSSSLVLKKNETEKGLDKEKSKPDTKETVEKEEETEEESEEKVEDEETEEDEKVDEEKDSEAKENERFDKHPRFQELNKKVKDMEPLAESQRGILKYCETHGITGDQFQQALTMAALMNTDPVKARAALLPIMESLDSYVGEKLPQDLSLRVEKGTLDINDAKEIAKLRAERSMSSTRTQQTQEQMFNQSCVKAVTDWETSKQSSDPDYAKKEPLIISTFTSKLMTARSQGKEPSPQDRVRLAEEAWTEVTSTLTSFMPKKAVKTVLRNQSRSTSRAEAKTPLELATQIAGKYSTD